MNRWPWIIASVFLGVATLGSLFHEFWRDEATTWLVLRSASSLSELYSHVHQTGYPPTWYAFLWLLKEIIHDPIVLQISNVAFASIAIFFFLKHAPFTREQKLLFCFGFYPLYQYGVIARVYSLIMALLFLYATLRPRLRQRPFLAAGILSLLAILHPYSWFASGALLLWEIAAYCRAPKEHRGYRHLLAATMVLVAQSAMLLYLMSGASCSAHYAAHSNPWLLLKAYSNAFFPQFGTTDAMLIALHFLLGISLWLGAWLCFGGRLSGLLLYAILTGGLSLLLLFVYFGHRWHHGLFFLFFVLSLWLSKPSPGPSRIYERKFLTLLFGLHACIGLYAVTKDITQDYSGGKALARYVQTHRLERLPMVGVKVLSTRTGRVGAYTWEVDDLQSVLVHLPGNKTYDPVEGRFVPYWTHYLDRGYFALYRQKEMSKELKQIRAKLQKPVLVVVSWMNWKGETRVPSGMKKLADFPTRLDGSGPFKYGEDLSLYLLE